jgi:hypothetical protein
MQRQVSTACLSRAGRIISTTRPLSQAVLTCLATNYLSGYELSFGRHVLKRLQIFTFVDELFISSIRETCVQVSTFCKASGGNPVARRV